MILNTDNALQFIEKVNLAFSGAEISTRLNASMSASEIITALNLAFSSYQDYVEITTAMDAEDVISAVNQNISLIGGAGNTIKFLHISDVHNSPDAITHCKTMMDADANIEATIFTGDYSTGGTGIYSSVTTPMSSLGNKLLMLNGNHDVRDAFNNNQANATAFLKSYVTDQIVEWGDSNNIASYWFRDYQITRTSKLRVIAVDSYEYNGISETISQFDTIYTQKQVNWIISRLMELSSTDFFIICLHEPPVNGTIAADYSYNVSGKMDDDILPIRRLNDFCSSRLWVWDSSLSNGVLLPKIVDAYVNRRVINTSVYNRNSTNNSNYLDNPSVSVNADFSANTPATFLFYLGGHLHGDLAAYHPYYPSQLILLVDCANPKTMGNSSDIGTRSSDTADGIRSNGILINEISLDFINQLTTIKRVGQNAALSYNGFSAITRNSISFPFVKQ